MSSGLYGFENKTQFEEKRPLSTSNCILQNDQAILFSGYAKVKGSIHISYTSISSPFKMFHP